MAKALVFDENTSNIITSYIRNAPHKKGFRKSTHIFTSQPSYEKFCSLTGGGKRCRAGGPLESAGATGQPLPMT